MSEADVVYISQEQHELAQIADEFAAKWGFDVRPGVRLMATAKPALVEGQKQPESADARAILEAAESMRKHGQDDELLDLVARLQRLNRLSRIPLGDRDRHRRPPPVTSYRVGNQAAAVGPHQPVVQPDPVDSPESGADATSRPRYGDPGF